jgi:hypothetical protein
VETTGLIQEVSKLLAPVLPLLVARGGAAAKKMMEKAGEATWGKISSCWEAISKNAEDKLQEKAALQNAIAQEDLGQRTASLDIRRIDRVGVAPFPCYALHACTLAFRVGAR